MLLFEPIAHVYTWQGRVVPSVTQLLAPIKPDFSMVPPAVLEAKRALGVLVHEACEYDDDGDLDEESLPDQAAPYVAAWRKFRADTRCKILANERKLFHSGLLYAGTLDRFAEIRGELWVIDLKTAAHPHPSYGVQTAGYAELLQANDGHFAQQLQRGSVHLFPDGAYKLVPYKNPNDYAAFRACLSIFHWMQNAK